MNGKFFKFLLNKELKNLFNGIIPHLYVIIIIHTSLEIHVKKAFCSYLERLCNILFTVTLQFLWDIVIQDIFQAHFKKISMRRFIITTFFYLLFPYFQAYYSCILEYLQKTTQNCYWAFTMEFVSVFLYYLFLFHGANVSSLKKKYSYLYFIYFKIC